MRLRDIYSKRIDRPFEGVIKADDEKGIVNEFDEYVLTNEATRNLEIFLDHYIESDNVNGAWISGFFGSGKSHLLKILSYLLENRSVGGETALERFLPKCRDNEMLKSRLEKAASIPSKSVLFNIDQQAEVIRHGEFDALLGVFMKVFDEMCGYFGKQGHVAWFERELDRAGLYGDFKRAFLEISGKSWESGRERTLIYAGQIDQAYAQVTGAGDEASRAIIRQYRQEYRVSIEDFADLVKAYIDREGKGFRLNFLVDEVGQFIAEETKLMTNLQTIAESLATKCRGRAWLIVTAQQDMDTVVGQLNKHQYHDYSKIKDRFACKLALSGANVEQVIQKRLLDKTDQGRSLLGEIYESQKNNLRTLFEFEGNREYPTFAGREGFIDSYPFVPYQYRLFQEAIKGLSDHNAFEGRYTSLGERSMLGVFREVAVGLADEEVPRLASFDLLYGGFSAGLKDVLRRSVNYAEEDLQSEDPFAVRVLKALFLVKYVQAFTANIRNLCVLLRDSFDSDTGSLTQKVEAALTKLEQQNYVERNGEEYQFLTDQEQDIEQEIRDTQVSGDAVTHRIKELAFGKVLGLTGRCVYPVTGQSFSIGARVDDKPVGRPGDLAIHIVTPLSELSANHSAVAMASAKGGELVVATESDSRFAADLQSLLKTEKYIQQRISSSESESTLEILHRKQARNKQREKDLTRRIEELLGGATLFVQGQEVPVTGSDPKERLERGFGELVRKTYPNLRMVEDVEITGSQVRPILAEPAAIGGDTLTEAEQEERNYVARQQRQAIRVTVKSLVEQLGRSPYGWAPGATLTVLASLAAKGKLECRAGAGPLEGRQLAAALADSGEQSKIILQPTMELPPEQWGALKQFYQELFHRPPAAADARSLIREIRENLNKLADECDGYLQQQERYPFLAELQEASQQFRRYAGEREERYLENLEEIFTELLDTLEDLVHPLREFMQGTQREIYDELRDFLQANRENLAYLDDRNSREKLRRLNEQIDSFSLRSGDLREARGLKSDLETSLATLRGNERQKVDQAFETLWESLATMDVYAQLDETEQNKLIERFQKEKDYIRKQHIIGVMRERLHNFRTQRFAGLIAAIAESFPPDETDTGGTRAGQAKPVNAGEISIDYEKSVLETEEDVERYTNALRAAFKEIIKERAPILLY